MAVEPIKIPSIKGVMIKELLQLVHEDHGDHGTRQLLAQFSPADRQRLNSCTNETRIPAVLFDRLYLAITSLWGKGQPDHFANFIGEAAERNIHGFLKFLILFNNPTIMAHSVPRLFKYYFDTGTVTMLALKKKYVEFKLVGAEPYGEGLCHGIISWGKKGLTMTGAKNIKVNHQECLHKGRPVCIFKVWWE